MVSDELMDELNIFVFPLFCSFRNDLMYFVGCAVVLVDREA